MKKINVMIIALLSYAMILSCKKGADESSLSKSNNSASGKSKAEVSLSWVNVIPASSFSSYSTYWNNLYPWGSDHNGSARMRAENISTSSGELTFTAYPGTVADKSSIHYFSGTCYAKSQVTVSDAWPKWQVKGEFQAPSAKGTWPAFWLTAVNSWPPESDIMEFKGSTTCWTNTYKNESGGWSSLGTTITNPGTTWHTYTAYLYKKNSTDVTIEYWIDGVKKATHTGAAFMNAPLWLILDLQMEGSSGTPGPTGNTYMRARNVIVQKSATM